MDYKTFLSYNLIGGLLWGIGMTVAGYFLGSLIPADEVDKYLLPIVGLIIILSVLPAVWHVIVDKKEKKAHAEKLASESQT